MTEIEVPQGGINPSKLIGKPIFSVTERMDILGLEYRVIQQNGLITADHNPRRYSLMINEDDIIIDAALG